MVKNLRDKLEIEQELILETEFNEAMSTSPDSESELDDDTVAVSDSNKATGNQDKIWSPQHSWNSCGVHPFIRTLSGLYIQEAPHTNKVLHFFRLFSTFHECDPAVGGTDINPTTIFRHT
jgi:hypothetical protein